MKCLLVFLVFAMGEITIGEALKCLHCKAFGGTDCSGPSIECENENDFCTLSVEHNIEKGDRKTSVSRGCKNLTSLCNTISVTTIDFSITAYTKCCHTENCNSEMIEMPELNTTENGYFCKSYFVEDNYVCAESADFVTIPCHGNERDCLNFIGQATRPGEQLRKYSFSGCATAGTCDVGYVALIGTEVGPENSLSCPDDLRVYPVPEY